MLESLTASDFEDLTGDAFQLHRADSQVAAAELLQVQRLSSQSGPSGRAPFSLLFACSEDTEAVQAPWEVEHDAIGRLNVFLVPVGKDERGLLLEAVFT